VGKILGDFSGSQEPVTIVYTDINGNFIFDLQMFTLQEVFTKQTVFINQGMGEQTQSTLSYIVRMQF
jgi:hypothetical protein